MVAKPRDVQSRLSTAAAGALGECRHRTHRIGRRSKQRRALQNARNTEESNYQNRPLQIRRDASTRTASEAEQLAQKQTAARAMEPAAGVAPQTGGSRNLRVMYIPSSGLFA